MHPLCDDYLTIPSCGNKQNYNECKYGLVVDGEKDSRIYQFLIITNDIIRWLMEAILVKQN